MVGIFWGGDFIFFFYCIELLKKICLKYLKFWLTVKDSVIREVFFQTPELLIH